MEGDKGKGEGIIVDTMIGQPYGLGVCSHTTVWCHCGWEAVGSVCLQPAICIWARGGVTDRCPSAMIRLDYVMPFRLYFVLLLSV